MAIDLRQTEFVKEQIKELYLHSPQVHMDISLTRPRIQIKDAEATIIGAYAHIFRIEESISGSIRTHSLQYGDILMGYVTIRELKF